MSFSFQNFYDFYVYGRDVFGEDGIYCCLCCVEYEFVYWKLKSI